MAVAPLADMPDVLGLGEVLWDHPPSPHPRQPGGAPANFAFHAAHQGLNAAPVSAVGDDAQGQALLDELCDRDIDVSLIARVASPTGRVDVTLDDGKPTYVIHEGVAWDHVPLMPALLAAAASARAVSYGTLARRSPVTRATIDAVLDATPAGCLRVFDVNLRPPFVDADAVASGLSRATLFKLSDEEVPEVAALLGLPADEEAFVNVVFLANVSLEYVAVTRGSAGSSVYRRDGFRSDCDAHVSRVVSTVGAGDSFTAGLVAGLLRGNDVASAHASASRLAAFVVGEPGAMPEVPEHLRL